VVGNLNSIIKEEEILWRQRSIVHWLKEGNSNSSYFNKIANGRRRRNVILSFSQKMWHLNNKKETEQAFYLFYKSIFGQKV